VNHSGEGSGIIISDDGYIATNSHVVNDNTGTGVVITLSGGEQYLGTIIGIDKKTDIAVIKISAENLSSADFANSDTLFVGQDVYAIGNPGGSAFSNSLTKGTVSAVNRILSTNGYVKYIQTDAAINPGNSGGALVNDAGQVIGMNTSKLVATDYEGMGFSIPSNKVVEIVNKLIKYGYVNDRGTLGIEGTTCNLYQSRKNNVPQGMVITKINSYSPLSNTQAKEKDIITEVNGVTVKSSYEFIDQLSKYKPGDKVTLKLFRAAATMADISYSFEVQVELIDDNL
jgi:serine protease Do